MYRCETCGNTCTKPLNAYEPDGSISLKCRCCGSESVRPEAGKCDICGRIMYSHEHAYEAGSLLICRAFITEVMI